MEFKGVIFDLDGTLVNADRAHLEAWKIALQRLGINLDRNLNIQQLFGLRTIEIARKIINDENKAKSLANLKNEIYRETVRIYAKPIECSIEILTLLKNLNISIAIVTSSSKIAANETLKILGYEPKVLVTGDDVNKGKPDPEPILLALKLMNLEAKEVIGVGDTLNDLLAYSSGKLKFSFIINNNKININEINILNIKNFKILNSLCELKNILLSPIS
jgi:HAD superfamily hydrolase (TIGR01509 family)